MEENRLKREISLFGAFSTVMGTVIGAGVFFKTASVVSFAQSSSLTIFAWILGGILTICAGLTSAELATAIPKTGGAVKYIEYTYGKLPGFLLGWAQSVIYFPANIAALSIIFSTQFIHLFHLSNAFLLPIALITGLSVTIVNLMGTRLASNLQSFTLIIKMVPIALIVLVGLFMPANAEVALFPIKAGGDNSFIHALSGSLLATMFAYDGWLGVGAVAGEMKHPEKDLPKAIFLGLTFITIVYVLINLVFLKTLPVEQLSGNLNAASDVSNQIFGSIGGKLVTIGILISVYGALNGYTMTGIRVPYALALEEMIPFSQQFKKLSKTFVVPYIAGIFQFSIAAIMMFFGSFDLLTDMLVFVMWLFSLLIFSAVFILRKKEPDLKRPYKVPLFPVIPIIAMLGGLFILITTLYTQTILASIGIGITLLGVPVYFLNQKIRGSER
ncbi:amino acid permease [Enterococcus moraviensis ATCC BAA-383]|uniref:Amino acid permease n=1 Tax=Enterococcus moraviensis ATCC BAA-383 TaxID=1158609 RepID=R2R2I6_9ENTE|nr:amino acid permease [Enterococcus moraviensis]EOI03075.1 amino acid permease [Enterococcus moraviensis ATCC BAA-383]EOT74048.1 amino acid permease [Enterococcus moraviensis ATCC BAA-383]OJG67261.1 amino acid permease [Enterococcus moraviensis]